MRVLALDLGGTFVKYAICEVDKKNGNVKFLKKDRFRTTYKEMPYGWEIIDKLSRFAKEITKKDKQIECVCGSIGGVIDGNTYQVLSPHHKFQDYHMVNVLNIFRKHCKLPFYIINDVKAAALGELRYGCLKGSKDVAIMLAIGTGIGSAPIINGKLFLGQEWSAGECAGMVVNNHWFENHYGLPPLINRCKEIDESIVTAEDCLEKMKHNKAIKNTVDAWFVGLLEGVSTYLYLFNPKYFVFGGKISEHKYFDLKIFKKLMLKNCRQPPFACLKNVKLLKAELGNDAALYGAASLAWKKDYKL